MGATSLQDTLTLHDDVGRQRRVIVAVGEFKACIRIPRIAPDAFVAVPVGDHESPSKRKGIVFLVCAQVLDYIGRHELCVPLMCALCVQFFLPRAS